jgi:transposase
MFESKTDSSAYHNEMNAENFEEWLRGILPKLQEDSILVPDNALYHSRKVKKTPTAA